MTSSVWMEWIRWENLFSLDGEENAGQDPIFNYFLYNIVRTQLLIGYKTGYKV